MGVREQVIEDRPSYDKDTGVYTGTSTYERPYEEAPGISPLLVAELLDHSIFFSLGDLGKALPDYEEIALPVTMDADIASCYRQTQDRLKRYLIDRRWEGDTTFRGAYLQWSMGWVNAPFRPYEVIHNIKNPITKKKQPYTVAHVPSYGEDRIYAKEQALLDLVQAELAENRPVVIFLRQTATRDIQPRIADLIRKHVAGAKPFILKNTVDAEKREKVIEAEVAKGANVILSNPELVKTGLDLVFAPTLVFFEIVFNLGTMMQAAGRSYRLNQTHSLCKTYYLYYADTMEETAVHLMSRKQRAAKLLNGDIGLTGLDALTQGEGGLEEALLNAIGREESLVDPSQLFKATAVQSEIDNEDAAYWNVEVGSLNIEQAAAALVEILIPAGDGAALTEFAAAHQPSIFDLPVQEAAPADTTLIPDVDIVVKALEDCGGKITSISVNVPPKNDTLPKQNSLPVKHSSTSTTRKRRRFNLLDAPEDDPISPLNILAGNTPARPAKPAMSTHAPVQQEAVTQLALL